jgi:hypothetical protein
MLYCVKAAHRRVPNGRHGVCTPAHCDAQRGALFSRRVRDSNHVAVSEIDMNSMLRTGLVAAVLGMSVGAAYASRDSDTAAVVLVTRWIVGLVGAHTFGGLIHTLLVLGVTLILVRMLQGRAA